MATKYTAFIFARGGSKGLPNKNIKNFLGKPLIGWAIEQALLCPRISRVLVSTDSEDIASEALKHGAQVPFLRPKELALDNSPEWLAWRHAIHEVSLIDGSPLQSFISLPTTSPLRSIVDINNCLDLFEQNRFDIVITVTESHRNPYFNMVKLDKHQYANLLLYKPDVALYRRQDAPIVFDITTVAYVAKSDFVLNKNTMFEGAVGAVEVPRERSIDIDTQIDFDFAQYILKAKINV
ncbi:MAG: acylneuraminate cytidylyltransferase family protein [Polynucleobacter sp.]|nr:acylneuraminate cytidylyltransferase family protein [Polynucleobacter sp.]